MDTADVQRLEQRMRDVITIWSQATDDLSRATATFDARGGAAAIDAAKHIAPDGGTLTAGQIAENAAIDAAKESILEMAGFSNRLQTAFAGDAAERAIIARQRTDF